jgi:pyridoxal phosphate enzyme (YggS family)
MIAARALAEGPVASSVAAVSERIARACDRVRRDPRGVTLVGVTKTVPIELVRAALDAGIAHLGENRVQEALPKMRALSDRAPTWHFIGHLQSNKARLAAETFDVIESVDSVRVARVLEEDAEEIGRELRVFVQVKVGDETAKSGVPLDLLAATVEEIDEFERIEVVGLMAIPPPRTRAEDSRADFRQLRGAFEKLRVRHPEIEHLSMGMSSDFEIAIEEGATEVRVGTALFGRRSTTP